MFALILAATLRIDTAHVLARFDPRVALGAGIDVQETPAPLDRSMVRSMLSAGFQPLSYRLATELGSEAWHWNPRGIWSDAAHQQGYWTSSTELGAPIDASYGYRLPRRGNTIDQSRNDGYSRIDDGDLATFWKSNPYLADRPQWILIDLGARHRVDRIDVTWGEPHATKFESQYWRGDDPINAPAEGEWLPLAAHTTARYVRVWMTRSAERGPQSADWRDSVGYAIREIAVIGGGRDWVHHAPSHAQSVIWVSSTDPWHRASDIDASMVEPGLDAVFASGLTRDLPMLTPVALLYGTPEDAAAEIAYLRARRYNVAQIELGEEPDGQNVAPEDYAALYARWAEAIHHVDLALQLGGPSLQSTRDVVAFWPDEHGRTSWMARFLAGVDRRDFNFFSFEWYPVDDVCAPEARQLAGAASVLDRVLGAWRREGVPTNIPWIAAEYGWSSYAAHAEVDMAGAIFDAEFVADFLAHGGAAAYFYAYGSHELFSEKCGQYGALTLFLGRRPVPAYYATQLLTHEWLQASGVHELYTVSGAPSLVRAFAVRRPDGTLSMLIINKDAKRAHRVQLGARTSSSAVQFAKRKTRRFRAAGTLSLPPYSITVATAEQANP